MYTVISIAGRETAWALALYKTKVGDSDHTGRGEGKDEDHCGCFPSTWCKQFNKNFLIVQTQNTAEKVERGKGKEKRKRGTWDQSLPKSQWNKPFNTFILCFLSLYLSKVWIQYQYSWNDPAFADMMSWNSRPRYQKPTANTDMDNDTEITNHAHNPWDFIIELITTNSI